uniref:Uncharacterized protein n=1 Tax=Odontella aurita TaxID=265563 RepID=A0A6U6G5F1_9STRA|mmetsp:Transcript_39603/g.118889  ORF Transcript_39603/g.118889 Transcript_39603/m.118889 type:complete len:125 (+) Transcript_39603:291-665(+)
MRLFGIIILFVVVFLTFLENELVGQSSKQTPNKRSGKIDPPTPSPLVQSPHRVYNKWAECSGRVDATTCLWDQNCEEHIKRRAQHALKKRQEEYSFSLSPSGKISKLTKMSNQNSPANRYGGSI